MPVSIGGKRIDYQLLAAELTAAGVPFTGLASVGDLLMDVLADGDLVDMPDTAQPVVDAHDATRPERTAAFESDEDAERLRIVNERARVDPAFAALASLALGKERA
jgi:hypothetical protein